ncbi:MAG: ComF family protein [Deltaproteobacteria bacterium]|nr:ComF family protein [Deltaproteobacteria bacterium]
MTRTIIQRALNILLPQVCRACGCLLKNSDKICNDCFCKIRWIGKPHCTICGSPFESSVAVSHPCPECLKRKPAFDWHRSCVLYEEPVNRILYHLKYSAGMDCIGVFAEWFEKIIGEQTVKADYLIPVPLSMGRLRRRSYNQSVELAKKISHRTGIPVLIHSLQKIRKTVPQTELPREERLKNLRGAFAWKEKKICLKDKNVFLIDDVFTTGSTLNACASALKLQKPAMVGAMTIALNLRH